MDEPVELMGIEWDFQPDLEGLDAGAHDMFMEVREKFWWSSYNLNATTQCWISFVTWVLLNIPLINIFLLNK